MKEKQPGTPPAADVPPGAAGEQLCRRVRSDLDRAPAGTVAEVPAAQVRKAFGRGAPEAVAAQAAAFGLSVGTRAVPPWVFQFRLMDEARRQEEATQMEDRERQENDREEAARPESPAAPRAPSPAQWKEMRARRDDNLAAAREILKDAGSVTRWSRVLGEQAQGLLRQGRERRGERTLVVRMEGNVDLVTSPRLLALLLELAEDADALGRSRTVLLDLRGVDFIDLSGCRAMIGGSKALRDRGLTLAVLHRPSSQPERTFLAMSLGMVIRRVQSLDDL